MDRCAVLKMSQHWDADSGPVFLTNGMYLQVRIALTYPTVKPMTQLNLARSGLMLTSLIDQLEQLARATPFYGPSFVQLNIKLTRLSPFISPTIGLPPPGNTLDSLNDTQFGGHVPDNEKRVINLADILRLPTPARSSRVPFVAPGCLTTANSVIQETTYEARILEDSDLLDSILEFIPEHEQPWTSWETIPDLHPAARVLMESMPTFDFFHGDDADVSEYLVCTDGTYNGTTAAWAGAIFALVNGSWQVFGLFAAPVRLPAHVKHSALTGEQFALLATALWLTRFLNFMCCQRHVSFCWDCMTAGKRASGEHGLGGDVLALQLRFIMHALEALLGQDFLHHHHVRAHAEIGVNELVDSLSKWANTSNFKPDPVSTRLADMIALDDFDLRWLWVHLQPKSQDLPTYDHGHWSWTRGSTDGIDFDRVLRTSIWTGAEDSTGSGYWHFDLTMGSYNCLTLADLTGEAPFLPLANRVALLRKQVVDAGFHLMGLQEARTEPGLIRSSSHIRFCSGCAADKTLGVEFWVSLDLPYAFSPQGKPICFRSENFAVVHSDPRILIIRHQTISFDVVFAVAHAPHSGRDELEIEQWWHDFVHLLTKWQHLDIVVLIDANQRLCDEAPPAVGDLLDRPWVGKTNYLTNCLLTLGLMAPSSFSDFHVGSIYTWTHPGTKKKSRIDYILVPVSWSYGKLSSWVDDNIHAAHAAIDHQCTALAVGWSTWSTTKGKNRMRYDQDAMQRPDAAARIAFIMQNAPCVPWHIHATEHAAVLTEFLQNHLAAEFPRQKRMRHWTMATETTLAMFHDLTALKRKVRDYSQIVENIWKRFFFDMWCQRSWDHSNFVWASQTFRQLAWHSARLPRLSHALTKAVKTDKKAFVQSVANEAMNSRAQDVFRALRPILGTRKTRRSVAQPLPQVLKLDGHLTQSPRELADRWTQHFADIEAGAQVSPLVFLHQAVDRQACHCLPSSWEPNDLPHLHELEAAIRASRWNRAAGLDFIPNEIYKINVGVAARLLYPLACKFALRLQEPIQWKGGQLVSLYKGKGSFKECGSFRGILLLSTMGKIVRASMRRKIIGPYIDNTDSLQLGGKPCQQVLFGSQSVRCFMAWQKQQGSSAAVIFCDVAAAFYAALRQVAVGATMQDEDVARIAKHFHLSEDVMPQLYEALHGRSAYSSIGANAAQQAYLKVIFVASGVHSLHLRSPYWLF